MSKVADRLPWYDFSRLWSFNGYYNMVLGARGTGKTFGAKIKGIKDAINRGHEFIYLRRYKDEIKFAKDGFFADVVAENMFPGIDFKVDGNKGYWDYANHSNGEPKKDRDRDWKPCVHFFALSVGGQIKSQSFPNVKLIIYDEFIIEKGDRKSTRLNSSHVSNSYAVFCLKKKIYSHTIHYRNTITFDILQF